ncbi:MAG TPA: SMC-Scp complex subunit ScpB [Rhodospirillales bacterium]|nr:SMC-Scp complex subunit ScpB [Rhodospirillales bacterium]
MTEINTHALKVLEALIFASAEPVPKKVLEDKMPDGVELDLLLEELKSHYANRGVNLVNRGNGWAFRTDPLIAQSLMVNRTVNRKLSRAAVETLAICAYHQPVTRAEIEEIRGVGLSKGIMDVLFEAGWIRPRGRRRTPGRPVTWGTTERFLDHFAMESIDDLPGMDELKAAGLIDKRPAIQTLSTRANTTLTNNPDELEELPEKDLINEIPLDPDDGEDLASLVTE